MRDFTAEIQRGNYSGAKWRESSPFLVSSVVKGVEFLSTENTEVHRGKATEEIYAKPRDTEMPRGSFGEARPSILPAPSSPNTNPALAAESRFPASVDTQ
jgi:hypothetical protein